MKNWVCFSRSKGSRCVNSHTHFFSQQQGVSPFISTAAPQALVSSSWEPEQPPTCLTFKFPSLIISQVSTLAITGHISTMSDGASKSWKNGWFLILIKTFGSRPSSDPLSNQISRLWFSNNCFKPFYCFIISLQRFVRTTPYFCSVLKSVWFCKRQPRVAGDGLSEEGGFLGTVYMERFGK